MKTIQFFAKTDDMNTSRLFVIAAGVSLLLILVASPRAFAQCALPNGIIFVTNTNDGGPGSLREAIVCANNTPGPNTIRFNIVSLQDQVFMVGDSTLEPLPAITDDGTIIDGSTQAGFGLNGDFTPRIILDGSAVNWDLPVNGLTILADNFGIYGLEIRNFPYNGIEVRNGDDGTIGDPQRMNIIYSNGEERDIYPMAPVTGMYNGSGIFIRSSSTNVTIENNIIGSDETLTDGKGNEWAGIRSVFNSFNNFIGRNEDGRRNTILHNPTGVLVVGSLAQRISGNLFLCNDTAAIVLLQNSNNNKPAPVITAALTTGISGTGQNNTAVEVYLNATDSCPDAACQGSVYLGSAEVTGGVWHLPPPFHGGLELLGGESVTALAVDLSPISANSSPFSSCRTVIDPDVCANSQGEITVTNTADGGIGSLRYAIGCANAVPGPNTILFDIPADQFEPIFVSETTGDPLPPLTDASTIIDGTSQLEGRPVLDGSLTDWDIPHNALFIQADSCAIFGLEIRNFPDDAIDITNASAVRVGRPGGGNIIHSNGSSLDDFPGLPGTGPWEGSAVVLKGTTQACVIQSNSLGVDASGQLSPNELAGIRIRQAATGHRIGGIESGQQNTIAGHPLGIVLESTATQCDIQANSISCNTMAGIQLEGTANQSMQAPIIDSAEQFSFTGQLPSNAERVDVYAQTEECGLVPCQGSLYLGTATINGTDWSLDSLIVPIPPGSVTITATATNLDGSTSAFAACMGYVRQCDSFATPELLILPDNCMEGVGSISLDPADPLSASSILFEIRRTGGNPPTPVGTPLNAGTYQVIITDMQGCADTLIREVPNTNEPTTAQFSSNPQGLAVTFDNTSEQADSAHWSFGDGTTSPLLHPVHTFAESGIYEVCLTASGPCNDDTFCRSIFVLEQDNAPVFRLGQTTGEPGDTITVPVTTRNFSDLIGFQFSAGLPDTSLATIISVSGFQVPGLSLASFILNSDRLAVSWFDFGLTGVSIPDETTIFEVVMVLKDSFSGCIPLNFINDPTPAEVILLFDGEDVKAPFILHNGEVCQPGSAEGLVLTPTGLPVGQVIIYCGGQPSDTTQTNGIYACDLRNIAPPITVRPEKLINARNGVSTFDMLRIQQHILKLDTFTDPFQIIAANADGSNKVSTIDLLHIQQVVLNIATQFPSNTSWRFVPASHSFPYPSAPLNGNYPQDITLASSGIDTMGLDFTGIKIGDVTQDSDPAEAVGQLPFSFTQLITTSQADPKLFTLTLSADPARHWSALQGTFQFDASAFDLVGIEENVDFPLLTNANQSTEGLIPFLWWDQDATVTGKSTGKDPVLTLHFRAKTAAPSIEPVLSVSNLPTETFAITNSGKRRTIVLAPPQTVTSAETIMQSTPLMICSPNPFSEYLNVDIRNVPSSEASIRIFDELGKTLYSAPIRLSSGSGSISIPAYRLQGASIFLIEARTEEWITTMKVLRNSSSAN